MTLPALVSVLIPAYNHGLYVQETLASIKRQTYPYLEIIIINDGSTDNTSEVIESFSRQHSGDFVRFVFINKQNGGISATLNQCVAIARGEFIFIIASDDVIADDQAIEKLVNFIALSPDAGVVCGDASFIDRNGAPISIASAGAEFTSFVQLNFPRSKSIDCEKDFGTYQSFLYGNYIPPGPLIRTSMYALHGKYIETDIVEDYSFWLRVSRRHRILLCHETLVHYRIHPTSTNFRKRRKILLESAKLLLNEVAHARETGNMAHWTRSTIHTGIHLLGTPTLAHYAFGIKLISRSMLEFVINALKTLKVN